MYWYHWQRKGLHNTMSKINNEDCMVLSVQNPVSHLDSNCLCPTIQRTSSKNNIPVIIYLLVLNMTKMQQVNLKPCLLWIFYKPQKSLTKLEDLHTFADLENCQFRKKKANSFFITNQSKPRYRKPNNSPIACTSSIHVNSYAYDEIRHYKHGRLLTTDLVMFL